MEIQRLAFKKKYNGLTRSTARKLNAGESDNLDFKSKPNGLHVDDLVAFANTDNGGEIILGVEEKKNADGFQFGSPIGCDVSDEVELQILNKAVSAIPPISVQLVAENVNKKAIVRVVIPTSESRPHCTPKGTYLLRDGSRNRPLHPPELLKIFLESEGKVFAQRFEDSAQLITEMIEELKLSLSSSVDDMASQLGWVDSQLGDTESAMHAAAGYSKLAYDEANEISERLRTLFQQDERKDPVRERKRLQYLAHLIEQIQKNDETLAYVVEGGTLNLKTNKSPSVDITNEDAKKLLKLALVKVREQEELKRYSIQVKTAKGCTESELDQFAETVADGREVTGDARSAIRRAYRLGIIDFDGMVVGTAGIKKPAARYRTKVFQKARSKRDPKDFPYELGWIFLKDQHLNKGQMTRLLKELLPTVKGESMFAATRTTNGIVRELLVQFGFSRNGEDYLSEQPPDQMLQLFIRDTQLIESKDE